VDLGRDELCWVARIGTEVVDDTGLTIKIVVIEFSSRACTMVRCRLYIFGEVNEVCDLGGSELQYMDGWCSGESLHHGSFGGDCPLSSDPVIGV
jgi:hypothetical protein